MKAAASAFAIAVGLLTAAPGVADVQFYESCNKNGCIKMHSLGATKVKDGRYDTRIRITMNSIAEKQSHSFDKHYIVDCPAHGVFDVDAGRAVMISTLDAAKAEGDEPLFFVHQEWCK